MSSICNTPSFSKSDREMSMYATTHAGFPISRLLEPWNDAWRFRSMTSGGLFVVWEGAVKWVLSRRKLYGIKFTKCSARQVRRKKSRTFHTEVIRSAHSEDLVGA